MSYYNYNFELGKELKELRKKTGKTIEQISEETGVTPKSVANWERGLTPRNKLFHRHLDSLGISSEKRIELVQLAYGKR